MSAGREELGSDAEEIRREMRAEEGARGGGYAARGGATEDSPPPAAPSRPRGDLGDTRGSGMGDGASSMGGSSREPRKLTQEQLYEIFSFYCTFGKSSIQSATATSDPMLDSFMFMKFCRECPGLLGGAGREGSLTRTDVDLIFTKAKPKFERRLDFEHFLDALSAIAEKKYPRYEPIDGLRLLLRNHLAATYELVQEERTKTGETEIPLPGIFKRLTDPRSYTGVYAQRFLSGDGRINGEADNRPGRGFRGSTNTGTDEIIHDISELMRPSHRGGTMMAEANHRRKGRSPRSGSPRSPRSSTRGAASGGGASGSPSVHAELRAALAEAAAAASEGRTEDLLAITARVKELEKRKDKPAAPRRSTSPRGPGPGVGGASISEEEVARILSAPLPLSQAQILEIFDFYCNFGRTGAMSVSDSLDSFMFSKLARETPGLLGRDLTRTDVDLIFTKAKPLGERRLTFTHFLDALSAIAEKKYPRYEPADGLRILISRHLAPLHAIVEEERAKTGETEIPLEGIYKRLTDPRSYTGVYAQRFLTGDGRINGEADNRPGRTFDGSTNTGTDEIIHDISVLMRPNLRGGTMLRSRPATAGGSPRRRSPRAAGAASPRFMSSTRASRSKEAVMEPAAGGEAHWYPPT